MNWLVGLQQAIDYMEEHILEVDMMSTSKIAGNIFSSEHNFRKVFSVITGVTVGEYIRNRRLSLAGEELLMCDNTVLDIALKYGYDTPESFTKAFTRFHGVTPSRVRKCRTGLKTYTRVVLRIEADGGTTLDYSLEELGDMKLVGCQQSFSATELEENNKRIPLFVKDTLEMHYDMFSKLCIGGKFADSIVGYRYDTDENMYYTVGIMTDTFRVNETIESQYTTVMIPARKWLRFRCDPPTKEAMQQLWYRIYTEFMPFSTYKIEENITLEVGCCKDGKEEKFLYMPLVMDNI